MPKLSDIRSMVIDMDGVLVRGERALPGLDAFHNFLMRRQIRFVVATNNSTVQPAKLSAKLERIGFQVDPGAILTSSLATARYLSDHYPAGTRIYVIGEPPLLEALQMAGFQLAQEGEQPRVVIVGLDRSVTWAKLSEAALALQGGAHFIGTNPDRSLPVEAGFALGSGALLASIEAATGVQPIIVGKPEPHIYTQALGVLQAEPGATLALGDRLETDILGGQRAGLATALVLTGASPRASIATSGLQPDWVFENLPQLISVFEGGLH